MKSNGRRALCQSVFAFFQFGIFSLVPIFFYFCYILFYILLQVIVDSKEMALDREIRQGRKVGNFTYLRDRIRSAMVLDNSCTLSTDSTHDSVKDQTNCQDCRRNDIFPTLWGSRIELWGRAWPHIFYILFPIIPTACCNIYRALFGLVCVIKALK